MKHAFLFFYLLTLITNAYSENHTVIIRTDLWCPYACDPKSERPGYMVEIAMEAFKTHGVKVDYDVLNWARSLSDTRAGLFNAVVGASRPDVKGFILPKNAIGKNENYLFTLKENKWYFKKSSSVENKKIGVINDYAYGSEIDKLVQNAHPSFTKIAGDDPLERLIRMTKAKRLDAFVENPQVLKLKLEELKLPLDLFKISSSNLCDDSELFIAFSPKNPKSKEYAEIIDREFIKMKKDGRLKKILNKYNVEMFK